MVTVSFNHLLQNLVDLFVKEFMSLSVKDFAEIIYILLPSNVTMPMRRDQACVVLLAG